jgi:hypothetical protein
VPPASRRSRATANEVTSPPDGAGFQVALMSEPLASTVTEATGCGAAGLGDGDAEGLSRERCKWLDTPAAAGGKGQ